VKVTSPKREKEKDKLKRESFTQFFLYGFKPLCVEQNIMELGLGVM